jgi:membrane glycosyltransferase
MDQLTRAQPDGRTDSARSFLPPEAPLAIPAQALRRDAAQQMRAAAGSGDAARPARSRRVPLRRALVVGATLALTGFAAFQMYKVFSVGGITVLEGVVLALFVLLFVWILLSTVSALIGFVLELAGPGRDLGIDVAAPPPSIATQNALLLPTYNEDPRRVMARLQAIYESVAETGQGARFDFFVLSDSTDPDLWVAEESAYLDLLARTGSDRIFYRHRVENIARKAGNIAEWISRFGGRYAHMIVLDADSLMTGDAVLRLVGALERHPDAGLVQTVPVIINATTVFARIQQFASRLYGPLLARGIAWWHGSESNYWGHNAAIRIAPFSSHAGLPVLPGRKPFGGHILSHDFVEAALMRRAGWGIHLVPDLPGSYEETPPSIADHAARDRRWCQGNLQHLGVLPASGLHWVSRLHMVTGIASYVTAPLWVVMLLVGVFISLEAHFIKPDYFPPGFSLFPNWPVQDPVRAAWLFGATMGVLVLPKLLAYVALLVRGAKRRGFGGAAAALASVIVEIVISGLLAPVLMLSQSRAVIDVLLGRDSGWSVQRRDADRAPWRDLARRFGPHTIAGILLAAAAYAVSVPLLLWMLPVILGLVLAIPLAAFTADERIGRAMRRLRLLLAPEERDPPTVLRRANELQQEWGAQGEEEGLSRLSRNPPLRAAHRAMIAPRQARSRGEIDVPLATAKAKLDTCETLGDAIAFLSPKEKAAVLADAPTLDRVLGLAGGCARDVAGA